MIGTRLGPYEILAEVGKGGMATVYRAYQPSVDRHVAVKFSTSPLPSVHAKVVRENGFLVG